MAERAAATGTSSTDLASAAGSCLCGAIAFQARLPTQWVAHCHCTRCQRAHGAAFVTWVGMAEDAVSIDAPERVRWHTAESGGSRGGCARCGSPMFFRSARWPGEVHIARALFSEPIDREPQLHGYYDSHVSWVTLGDELPRKDAPADT